MSVNAVNVHLVNPYLEATYSICEAVLGEVPTKSVPSALSMTQTDKPVNIVVGITGSAVGYVIIGMSNQTALAIASTMIYDPVKVFSSIVASAIGELANMICGQALTKISEAGFNCDITPPTIIRGREIDIATPAIPAIVVPLLLKAGEITLTIAIQNRN